MRTLYFWAYFSLFISGCAFAPLPKKHPKPIHESGAPIQPAAEHITAVPKQNNALSSPRRVRHVSFEDEQIQQTLPPNPDPTSIVALSRSDTSDSILTNVSLERELHPRSPTSDTSSPRSNISMGSIDENYFYRDQDDQNRVNNGSYSGWLSWWFCCYNAENGHVLTEDIESDPVDSKKKGGRSQITYKPNTSLGKIFSFKPNHKKKVRIFGYQIIQDQDSVLDIIRGVLFGIMHRKDDYPFTINTSTYVNSTIHERKRIFTQRCFFLDTKDKEHLALLYQAFSGEYSLYQFYVNELNRNMLIGTYKNFNFFEKILSDAKHSTMYEDCKEFVNKSILLKEELITQEDISKLLLKGQSRIKSGMSSIDNSYCCVSI